MRSVAGVLTLVSLTATACGREPASASVDIKAEEQAIRRISAQWLELTRQQEAARIAALFADDGRLLLGGQEVLIGVDRIREFMAKGLVPERQDPAIREVIVTPYRIVYRLRSGVAEIVTVFRGSRELPEFIR